ncbi:amidohydrolase [bacterium]|nr:amidohydrolase [bacterium]
MIKEEILHLAQAYFAEVRDYRRHLHQHPELSFHEYETAKYIAAFLQKEGIPFEDNWVKTGLVATIEGNNPGKKTIALRADIDALPIKELTGAAYASKNEGAMHACGHDVHTACLLGAALILNDTREQWEGTVKLIFQPGEEQLPGGASQMIAEGLFEKHPATAIFGQHVMPELEAGKVGFRKGMYMAACDELYLTVSGKGGHGAMPHKATDPILVSAHIVVALQQIVSRRANALLPTVLSIGHIEGKGATNVIPEKVEMQGTLRTYDELQRQEAHQQIKDLCSGLAQSMGAHCEVKIIKGYPPVNNHPQLTERAITFARELLGNENVVPLEMRPTGEDFAFYNQVMPGCFFRLGTGNIAKGITASVHSPHFDIDEEALKTGMAIMSFLAVSELSAD